MTMRSALLSLFVMGCDPMYSVSGRVAHADGGGVSDVAVTLECNGRVMLSGERSTRSIDGGSFALSGVGCLPDDCRLLYRQAQGTGSGRLRCLSRSFACGPDGCNVARVEITLEPATAGRSN
jgi:hypothetical protein